MCSGMLKRVHAYPRGDSKLDSKEDDILEGLMYNKIVIKIINIKKFNKV